MRFFCTAVAVLLTTRGGFAQSTTGDKAAAEALFDSGVALLRNHEYKEACEKLETSQTIDPAVGTLLYLGECYERLGRTASAWAMFREASSLAQSMGQNDRAKVANQRAQRLEADLAYLSVVVAAEARVPGLVVQRGKETVKLELFGVSIPTDPGDIEVRASAPGYAAFSENVPLAARQRRQLNIPALQRLPGNEAPPIPKTVPATPPDMPADTRLQHVEPVKYKSTPSPVAYVLGGVGLVGLGVGSFFGIRAIQLNSEAKEQYGCQGSICTDPGGIAISDDAVKAANVSNVAFAAGAALVISGVIVYLSAPRHPESALVIAPSASPTSAALTLRRAF